MGQQQLILLVLATVIVGVAIVVGIRAFTENDAKSNADAMMQDAVRMANDVQAWAKKPQPFGGPAPGTANAWTTAGFGDIGYSSATAATAGDPDLYTNLNGEFTLVGGLITGTSYEDDGTTDKNVVEVRVCGTEDDDIKGAIVTINGQDTNATGAPAC